MSKAVDLRERRRLQMADIARLAGVSVSTVSRALNGSSLVNKQTRDRVEELAKSLNYTINVSAKNLRLQTNQTVAVVIPYDQRSHQHISDPFFLAMVGALADALTDRGLDMLLTRVDAEDLAAAARPYESGRAVGVVLIGQWRHHDQLNELALRKIPLVVWGAQMPNQIYSTVGGDNVLGGELGTSHLLKRGRRRLVFLGDPNLPEVAQRREGFLRAMSKAGVDVDPRLLVDVPFDQDAAYGAVRDLAPSTGRFDGIVACSDLLALGAIAGLRASGLRVPQDVSVVGYDNIALSQFCDPPLTTIEQPIVAAGERLVESLLLQADGQRATSTTVPVRLVERQSA